MRYLVMLGAFLFSSGVSAVPKNHIFLIPERFDEVSRLVTADQVLFQESDAAVISVPENEVEAWSGFIHSKYGGCGGFIDVTHEMTGPLTPKDLVQRELLLRNFIRPILPEPVTADARIDALVAAVDANRLWTFLGELSSQPDRSATTANGTAAAQFLAQKATAAATGVPGFSTKMVRTDTYPLQPSVVASFPGLNPALPHIVIGGHMDTFSSGKPGADDDGSGSSVVMEALRVVAASGARFNRTIDFVWYAAEERGLVGSSFVVKDFQASATAVKSAIQFDMTGYKSPNDTADIYIIDDYTDGGLNDTLARIIAQFVPEAKVGHTKCGYACSDHANWTRAGVPAVFPFESAFENYNSAIHTSADTIALLNKDHSSRFAKVALAFLGHQAEIQ